MQPDKAIPLRNLQLNTLLPPSMPQLLEEEQGAVVVVFGVPGQGVRALGPLLVFQAASGAANCATSHSSDAAVGRIH